MIAWLVDAAAIVSQKALLKCSYAPYARIMKKICWEESFHILHGRDVILALVTGTDEQFGLVQEALDRWWEPLMHFHGNPIPAEEDPMVVWRIKSRRTRRRASSSSTATSRRSASSASRSRIRRCARTRRRARGSTRSPTGRSSARRHGPRAGLGGAARVPPKLSREDVAWVERVVLAEAA